MTTEESMRDDHLALAFECNRQLRAENEALRKDAERYRWLRKDAHTEQLEFDSWYWGIELKAEKNDGGTPEQFDAAIDAAMQPIPCTTAEQSKP